MKAPIKVIVAGAPQSGKSCLWYSLRAAFGVFGDYLWILWACPDGEGSWFHSATHAAGVDNARAMKTIAKGTFTPEIVTLFEGQVKNAALPLFGIDIGGKITAENRRICAGATHVIYLAGDDPGTGEDWQSRLAPWKAFAAELGLIPLAELKSDYNGTEDVIEPVGTDGIFRANIHHLDRNDATIVSRPAVLELARYLIAYRDA